MRNVIIRSKLVGKSLFPKDKRREKSVKTHLGNRASTVRPLALAYRLSDVGRSPFGFQVLPRCVHASLISLFLRCRGLPLRTPNAVGSASSLMKFLDSILRPPKALGFEHPLGRMYKSKLLCTGVAAHRSLPTSSPHGTHESTSASTLSPLKNPASPLSTTERGGTHSTL